MYITKGVASAAMITQLKSANHDLFMCNMLHCLTCYGSIVMLFNTPNRWAMQ